MIRNMHQKKDLQLLHEINHYYYDEILPKVQLNFRSQSKCTQHNVPISQK